MTTVAVVVGVSAYESRRFGDLPAAEPDARRFGSSLIGWGVQQRNVKVLTGPNATRRRILESVRVWPFEAFSGADRLIFYFAGHGARLSDERGVPRSAILPADADPSDRIATGITMSELMGAIGRLGASQSFVFLDACDLRFDDIQNPIPEPIPDSDVLGAAVQGSMFCMVAAGNRAALENTERIGGVFTDALLSAIASIRRTIPSCELLAQRTTEALRSQAAPTPEVYQLGATNTWFLPEPGSRADISIEGTPLVGNIPQSRLRGPTLASLQDAIVSEPRVPIYVWGESGIGKTTLVRSLEHPDMPHVYWSAAGARAAGSTPSESISGTLVDQLPSVFPTGHGLGSLNACLAAVIDRVPWVLVILDDFQRLPPDERDSIFAAFGGLPLNLVLVSQHPPMGGLATAKANNTLREWRCPLLTLNDVEEIAKMFPGSIGWSSNELLLKSTGNARKLVEIISKDESDDTASANIQRTVNAIIAANGYVDEKIFCATFEIEHDSIQILRKSGIVIFQVDHFVAHESLNSKRTKDFSTLYGRAAIYWCRQVQATPTNDYAWRALLDAVLQAPWSADCDQPLAIAIAHAARLKAWNSLDHLAAKLVQEEISATCAVVLSEVYVRAGKFEKARDLLGPLGRLQSDPSLYERELAVAAELAWWTGAYDDGYALATRLRDTGKSENGQHAAALSLGIIAFFRGEWEAAEQQLAAICEHRAAPRIIGWARNIRGTVLGLRGVDATAGRRFLESAIRLLESIGDDLGVASALGNMGEMNWKAGDLELALLQLTQAEKLAISCDNALMITEMRRNVVHVQLRLYGPYSVQLEEGLDNLRSMMGNANSNMETMQVWNTLATVGAYRGDLELLISSVSNAAQLTAGNKEYDIYTWGNTASLQALRGETTAATSSAIHAMKLASQGQNLLACRQILSDLDTLSSIHRSESTEAVAAAARYEYDRLTEAIKTESRIHGRDRDSR